MTLNLGPEDESTTTDMWNAQLVDGGVRSSHLTFKLHKDGPYSWIGERRSSFGFSFKGTLSALPKIVCTDFTKPFPYPPPPLPPGLPPAAPPHFSAREDDCFLGGSVTWLHTPDPEPTVGWAKPWQVSVRMPRWQPGVTIIIAFEGERLREHPLRVVRVDPADGGVRLESATSHSLAIVLLPSPLHAFTVTATGAARGMRQMTCCCHAPPPPPPPPPGYRSEAATLGRTLVHRPPPPPPPRPRHPFADREINGFTITSPAPPPLPPPPPKGDVNMWTRITAALVGFAALMYAVVTWLERRSAEQLRQIERERKLKRVRPRVAKLSSDPSPEPAASEALALVDVPDAARRPSKGVAGKQRPKALPGPQPLRLRHAGSDASSSDDDGSDSSEVDEDASTSNDGGQSDGSSTASDRGEAGGSCRGRCSAASKALANGSAAAPASSSRPRLLVVQVVNAGERENFKFDASAIESVADLEDMVSDAIDLQPCAMSFETVDAAGQVSKVTASTPAAKLRGASLVRLVQPSAKAKLMGEGGRTRLTARGVDDARTEPNSARGRRSDGGGGGGCAGPVRAAPWRFARASAASRAALEKDEVESLLSPAARRERTDGSKKANAAGTRALSMTTSGRGWRGRGDRSRAPADLDATLD